jgi:hypothetical protein
MKLREWRSKTVAESQAVLNNIKENDFHGASEVWEKWLDPCIHLQGNQSLHTNIQHFIPTGSPAEPGKEEQWAN